MIEASNSSLNGDVLNEPPSVLVCNFLFFFSSAILETKFVSIIQPIDLSRSMSFDFYRILSIGSISSKHAFSFNLFIFSVAFSEKALACSQVIAAAIAEIDAWANTDSYSSGSLISVPTSSSQMSSSVSFSRSSKSKGLMFIFWELHVTFDAILS